MADLEVKIIGDIGDLQAELEKLPGITKEEAAKIAKGMEKGMKDAEKAVKKASDGSTKAMQKVQKSAKKTGNSFKSMKRGASEMGRGIGELTLLLGDQESAMGQLMAQAATAGLALGAIVPVFGAMKSGLVAMGTSAAVATGGLSVLAGAAAIMISNMMSANAEQEEAKKKAAALAKEADRQEKSIKSLSKTYAGLSGRIETTIQAFNNLSDSFPSYTDSAAKHYSKLADLQDQLNDNYTESRRQREKLARDSNDLIESENKAIKERYENQKIALEKSRKDLASNLAAQKEHALRLFDEFVKQDEAKSAAHAGRLAKMYDTEDKRIQAMIKGISGLGGVSRQFVQDMEANEKAIIEIDEMLDPTNRKFFAAKEKEELENSANVLSEIRSLEEQLLKKTEAKKKAEEATAKAAEKTKELKDALLAAENSAASLNMENLNSQIAQTKEMDKLIELLGQKETLEVNSLNNQITNLNNQKEAAIASAKSESDKAIAQKLSIALDKEAAELAIKIGIIKAKNAEKIKNMVANQAGDQMANFDLEKMRLQELYDLERQLRDASTEAEIQKHELIMRQIEAREKQDRDSMNKLMGNTKSFFAARIELMQNSGRAEQEAITKLFYMQQAAAAAQVGIQTAENVVSANKLLPPVGPILAASYVALGGAQIAAIMSQSPPTARHMGGMANDEANYRLLSGEAVLSRQAVRNIGGEQGLKRMERGKGAGSEIIILQPFKHFDRYLNQRNKRKARRASNGSY